ncbi:hypothetical protein [sulfur-oxidizing endosymbiont of Gigantopelta aegis]|uniref:hypothetical protein n=1 Tax=sulfur-oxidizing endosymbiont of Gigantopelta aegis TaxID=2794934 RepID=UPI0018DD658A|nr:hypothetical protein [sulfur-oxidizing endosymbiont of Gigantopelta aegis]
MNHSISTEMLNAYIDNELDKKESQEIERAIKNDSELSRRLDEIQQLKLKVQASYATIRAPLRQDVPMAKSNWLPTTIAASLTLAVGVSSGWYGHQYIDAGVVLGGAIGSVNQDASVENLLGVKLQPVQAQDDKIIIHLAQNDRALFDKALAKAEALLDRFEKMEQKGSIQVLANSYGMDILRNDKSHYKERITKMINENDNIEFVACSNTIKRMEESGKQVDLIEGVQVHGPVIDEIVTHMQDGWTYIKI